MHPNFSWGLLPLRSLAEGFSDLLNVSLEIPPSPPSSPCSPRSLADGFSDLLHVSPEISLSYLLALNLSISCCRDTPISSMSPVVFPPPPPALFICSQVYSLFLSFSLAPLPPSPSSPCPAHLPSGVLPLPQCLPTPLLPCTPFSSMSP